MILNKLKKIALIFVAAMLITLLYSGCETDDASTLDGEEDNIAALGSELLTVELAGRLFELELALTDEARTKGLMFREEIAENGGMIFVYPPAEPFPVVLHFWMKNCLVPIDVIFLNPKGIITAIHEMKPPDSGLSDDELTRYSSNLPAQFAIELRGGMAAQLGLTEGSIIELPMDELLNLAR
jgi:uncharacterized protein